MQLLHTSIMVVVTCVCWDSQSTKRDNFTAYTPFKKCTHTHTVNRGIYQQRRPLLKNKKNDNDHRLQHPPTEMGGWGHCSQTINHYLVWWNLVIIFGSVSYLKLSQPTVGILKEGGRAPCVRDATGDSTEHVLCTDHRGHTANAHF